MLNLVSTERYCRGRYGCKRPLCEVLKVLEPHLAGMGEDGRAIRFDVLVQPQAERRPWPGRWQATWSPGGARRMRLMTAQNKITIYKPQ